MALERRVCQESRLIFKDHLLQIQDWFIPTSRKSSKSSRRPACMKKELLTELQHYKEAYERQKQVQVTQETLPKHAGK